MKTTSSMLTHFNATLDLARDSRSSHSRPSTSGAIIRKNKSYIWEIILKTFLFSLTNFVNSVRILWLGEGKVFDYIFFPINKVNEGNEAEKSFLPLHSQKQSKINTHSTVRIWSEWTVRSQSNPINHWRQDAKAAIDKAKEKFLDFSRSNETFKSRGVLFFVKTNFFSLKVLAWKKKNEHYIAWQDLQLQTQQ